MKSTSIVKKMAAGASSTLCVVALTAGAALADKTTIYTDRGYVTESPSTSSTTTTTEVGSGYGGSSTTTSTTVAEPARVTEVERPIVIKEKKKPRHLIHFLGVSVL